MERQSGYLCLNKYYEELKNKLNCQFYDLIVSGYIRPTDYDDRHFWLRIEDEEYYYKPSNYPYHEVLAYYIAKELGFNAVYCDLAKFSIIPSKADLRKGIISKNYRKKDCKYIPGYEILKEYYKAHPKITRKMGLTDNWKKYYGGPYYIDMNNLEIIWQALESKYQNNPNANISKLMNQIIENYIFAILVRANDKGAQNWELEESENTINIYPIFDNELIFYDENITTTISTSFDDSEATIGESVRRFLTTSSEEFVELFVEKFKTFNYDMLMKGIDEVEKQTESKIPDEIKEEIIFGFNLNQKEINEVLDSLNLNNKGR